MLVRHSASTHAHTAGSAPRSEPRRRILPSSPSRGSSFTELLSALEQPSFTPTSGRAYFGSPRFSWSALSLSCHSTDFMMSDFGSCKGSVMTPIRPNQSMKPTAPFRNKLTHSLPLFRPSACPSMSHCFPRAPFSVFAMTPSTSSRFPASLVRFMSSRSRTPAVLFFNDSRGLSLSR
jgi:hypothetical protein